MVAADIAQQYPAIKGRADAGVTSILARRSNRPGPVDHLLMGSPLRADQVIRMAPGTSCTAATAAVIGAMGMCQ